MPVLDVCIRNIQIDASTGTYHSHTVYGTPRNKTCTIATILFFHFASAALEVAVKIWLYTATGLVGSSKNMASCGSR